MASDRAVQGAREQGRHQPGAEPDEGLRDPASDENEGGPRNRRGGADRGEFPERQVDPADETEDERIGDREKAPCAAG